MNVYFIISVTYEKLKGLLNRQTSLFSISTAIVNNTVQLDLI